MKQSIFSPAAPKAVGPYSQAIQVGTALYISGQIPLNAETNQLVEGDIKAQTKQILKNIEEIIKAADPSASIQNVVKTTIFLINLEDFNAVNEVYTEIFENPLPARSTVQVAALPKGASIEIESIASID